MLPDQATRLVWSAATAFPAAGGSLGVRMARDKCSGIPLLTVQLLCECSPPQHVAAPWMCSCCVMLSASAIGGTHARQLPLPLHAHQRARQPARTRERCNVPHIPHPYCMQKSATRPWCCRLLLELGSRHKQLDTVPVAGVSGWPQRARTSPGPHRGPRRGWRPRPARASAAPSSGSAPAPRTPPPSTAPLSARRPRSPARMLPRIAQPVTAGAPAAAAVGSAVRR